MERKDNKYDGNRWKGKKGKYEGNGYNGGTVKDVKGQLVTGGTEGPPKPLKSCCPQHGRQDRAIREQRVRGC